MKQEQVIGLIMARGGSKGVPRKNLRTLGGFPLVAWSIVACKLTPNIDRTIMSTDDAEIAKVAKQFGAEVPFIRPAEFATDTARDYVVIKHVLEWLDDNENFKPKYVAQIRPTTPLRDPKLIEEAINLLKSDRNATGLVSVFELPESPWKMFEMDQHGYLQGLRPDDERPEYYTLPRQSFPPAYNANGYIDIIRPETILENKMTYGEKIIGFEVPNSGEVDVEEDFKQLEYYLGEYGLEIYQYLIKHYS